MPAETRYKESEVSRPRGIECILDIYILKCYIEYDFHREVENRLDDDIEEAESALDKERIETEKAYDDCSTILKEFDRENCRFSKDVEILLNVYANAFKNVTIYTSK